MPQRTRHLRCVVLDRTKLAEQDLILTMLSSEGEEVRAVAKGARKPGGRLASRSELFCESDLLLAKGRGSLEIVSEASIVEPHAGLRGDLARVSAASAVCEVTRLCSFQDVRDPYLYPICTRALAACEEARGQEQLDLVVAAYAFKLLAHGGWRPELGFCTSCGDARLSRFSSFAGGALCASCAKDVPGAQELSASEFSWLRALIGCTFDQLLEGDVPSLELSTLLVSLAHSWATTQTDARLRSLEFLLSV